MTTTTRATESSPVVIPADWIPGPKQGEWTYEDYAAIPEDGHRYEVIGGVLYMSPSPNRKHQKIVLEIAAYLRSFAQIPELGEVYVGPLDVELSYRNVVQPDILVVLNEHLDRITETHIIGAPDLVIEITDSNTANHDYGEKWEAYANGGVPEYWVVTPEELTIELLILDGNEYRSLGLFIGPSKLPSQVLPNLPASVEQLCTGIEENRQPTEEKDPVREELSND
ncbi:MAG TPA: Uma2 family endonuclease [Ktedonobacteraceae bacterium]|jgi:Uma2 family endonuclease|nr:Uma2 family endonuclease [Ktedonobacteraceae bacterium]